MATSGSNYYSPDGGTLRLVLSWSRIQTDIANNRSKIRLTLQLRHSGTGVWFSARKSGNLHGQSFTYSGGFSNTGTVTLRTRELWVNHDADGTKSITFNASFNIAITYRGSHLGNMSTSVTANIDRIPRASSINSFSIASHLKPSTENTVNLSLSRATSSFTHDIELRDGSTVLSSWKGEGTPTSLNLTSAEVNTLLNRMSNVTSRTLTLRVITKSGSSTIGSTSKNATATVDSSVKPVVSGLTIGPTADTDFNGNYVQTHNKMTGSYSSSVRGGATIRSQSITVSKDDDILVISGTSGTTPRTFKYGGTYDVIAKTVDSRGRTSTLSDTISVLDYWTPRIEKFKVKRQTDTPTIVDFQVETDVAYYRKGDYWDTTIERQLVGTSVWEEVYSFREIWNIQSGTIDGNNEYNSYIFRLTVDDGRGGVATAITSIATQRVVLDIHKNEGVGIGKIHEHGVLDVDGKARFGHSNFDDEGKVPVIIEMNQSSNFTGLLQGIAPDGSRVWQLGNRMMNSRSLYLEATSRIRMTSNRIEDGDGNQLVESGSNANGEWVKFYDGTLICWHYLRTTSSNLPTWNITATWTFPIAYSGTPSIQTALSNHNNTAALGELEYAQVFASRSSSSSSIRVKPITGGFDNTSEAYVNVLAIGRWK